MARNVEIKAKVDNLSDLKEQVEKLTNQPGENIQQTDIFFHCENGRLKLRIFEPGRGELIFYRRRDQTGPAQSEYYTSSTADPDGLKTVLSQSSGIRGVVRKQRWLYWLGSTRIHLDMVEDLGSFMELEVVLKEGESAESGMTAAFEVMALLDISPEDLIDKAYIDLLEDIDGQ